MISSQRKRPIQKQMVVGEPQVIFKRKRWTKGPHNKGTTTTTITQVVEVETRAKILEEYIQNTIFDR